MAEIRSVEEFRRLIPARGQDFIYSREPSDDCVGIRFIGTFRGSELIWDTIIMTLAYYNAQLKPDNSPVQHRQIIDIARSGSHLRRIDIGLDVEAIDTATLLKTIVMVRKYRRLRIGRHQFGGVQRRR